MNVVEIKTYRWRCDNFIECRSEVVGHGQYEQETFPKDWATERVHGCGMTNYSKTIALCPKCVATPRGGE